MIYIHVIGPLDVPLFDVVLIVDVRMVQAKTFTILCHVPFMVVRRIWNIQTAAIHMKIHSLLHDLDTHLDRVELAQLK